MGVLTPSVRGVIPGGKIGGLRQELLRGSRVHARLAQAAQALNQHRSRLERIGTIDEIVEGLVVTSWGEVEELFNCALLCTSKAPPVLLEIKDAAFEVGKSGTDGVLVF